MYDQASVYHTLDQLPEPPSLDLELLPQLEATVLHPTHPTCLSLSNVALHNEHRTVGATLSHEIVKLWGAQGLLARSKVRLLLLWCLIHEPIYTYLHIPIWSIHMYIYIYLNYFNSGCEYLYSFER